MSGPTAERAATRSSSAAGTTRLVTAAYLAKAGRRIARPRAARTASAARPRPPSCGGRPRAAAGAHRRAAPAVGRQGSRPPVARPAPRRAGRPRLRAAARTAGAITLWADQARTVAGLRALVEPTTPTPTRSSTGSSARSAGSSPSSPPRRRPTSRRPGSATRSTGLKLGRTFRGLGKRRLPHDPARPADGGRRLRRRGVRDRRPAGRDRLARRPLLVRRAVVGRLDGDPARRRRGQRRRRGRPDRLRDRRPGRPVGGARRGGAGGRRRDPLRRRGRRDHLARQPRHRRRARLGRGDRARAVVVSGLDPEADRSSSSPTRSTLGPSHALAGRQLSGRRASWPRSTSSLDRLPRFTAAAGDDEQLPARPDPRRRPGSTRSSGPSTRRSTAACRDDAGPRGDDPVARRSVARRRGAGRHARR